MTPAAKTYLRDFGLAILLYGLAILGVNLVAEAIEMPRAALIALALLPVLPALLALRAVLVFSRSWDELQRRKTLEATLVSFLVVGFGSFAWGFAEGVPGIPRLPAIWILPALIGVQGLAQIFVAKRYG